ncbi:MAG: hypothetical protein U0L04_06990 [Bacteroidaceae bacterium]|nr:hypothetical protein [Bacteroidaceae bacterium]
MKNQSVVVMSGADVAAMRNAHKEAEAAYFQAKVGALRFAVSEMESTNKEYTLHELSALTGLTPMEITVQLSSSYFPCKAATEAGVPRNRIRGGRRVTERKFVEVMPSGELNPQSIMTVQKRESTYRILEDKNRR